MPAGTPNTEASAAAWRAMLALSRASLPFDEQLIRQIIGPKLFSHVKTYFGMLQGEGLLKTAPGGLLCLSRLDIVDAPPMVSIDGRMRRTQRQLWTAMRSLRTFNAAEIALHASTDDHEIGADAARRYCQRLTSVGYLVPGRETGGAPYWRLPPASNTGPRAPLPLRGERDVYDFNMMSLINGVDNAPDWRAAA